MLSYYDYLPATFIDKDLTLKFVSPENQYRDGIEYWYQEDEQGNRVLKYSMGMAVMYAPFFFAAHVLADPLGYPADGFSGIYEFFIEFSGLFYLLFGLLYLRKLLLKFFTEKVTALTLSLLFFGTNLLYYATVESAMSHAYTFSLFSIFLYYTYRLYEKVTFKPTIILALCFGLIVLIRPLNILLILPFLLFGISSFSDMATRMRCLFSHYWHGILFIGIVGLLLLPQLLYYKYVTGHYFVFSYGKEAFFFNQFHVLNVLFSFRKGWLVYTPVMLFALLGFWFIKNHTVHVFRIPLFVLFPVYLYLISCWWCWWYGGSFSQRPLIDIYPLLAFPLAAFIFKLQHFAKTTKIVLYTLLALLLTLNLFQTVQYKYNIIDYDGMTAKEYVQVFGTLNDEKIDTTLLDKPNYERAVVGLGE